MTFFLIPCLTCEWRTRSTLFPSGSSCERIVGRRDVLPCFCRRKLEDSCSRLKTSVVDVLIIGFCWQRVQTDKWTKNESSFLLQDPSRFTRVCKMGKLKTLYVTCKPCVRGHEEYGKRTLERIQDAHLSRPNSHPFQGKQLLLDPSMSYHENWPVLLLLGKHTTISGSNYSDRTFEIK